MLRPLSLVAARRSIAAGLGRRLLATPPAAQGESPQPLKLAIIGAGPSGLYAASRILAQLPADDKQSQVHVYERLPAPHGLVRYGVAADHPEVKVRSAGSELLLVPELIACPSSALPERPAQV